MEAFISASGRAIQGATSHHLGQNFSKMFNIEFEGAPGEKRFAYQNSWGLTTRTIGVMVMVHGDNKGLVLPPRIADVQAIIIPTGLAGLSDEAKTSLFASCEAQAAALRVVGIRAETDLRTVYSPPWKYNHYELLGVPLRLELGPKDVEKGTVRVVRRFDGQKQDLPAATLVAAVQALLDETHGLMLDRATAALRDNILELSDWSQVAGALNSHKIFIAPFCGAKDCEGRIKEDSAVSAEADTSGVAAMGAKSLCIPFAKNTGDISRLAKTRLRHRGFLAEESAEGRTCIHPACGQPAKYFTLFGRSY